MRLDEVIDTTFDFRSDTPPGKDPDTWSPTLRRYHQLLWSKPLPNGELFELDVTPRPPYYLHHLSELGEFWLSSDAVIPTFSRARETQHIIGQVPVAETAEFNRIAYTIGGMMVFPANQIDRKWTINQARGCHGRLRDRFDLTVECIRRHYMDEPSPLRDTLARYADFLRCSATSRATWTSSSCRTWWTRSISRSSSPCRSRTSRRRRCRRRATSTSLTASAPSNSSNPGTSASRLE